MIYIIDDSITYNSDDCTLTHLPTQESLSLSISSGRLLERLLDSDGEILARDTLLTEVWDKYGLRGSNSNLNQYLSIVRRALASYGCDNLIITIPKIGIRINTDINIERRPAPEIIVAPDPAAEPTSENSLADSPPATRVTPVVAAPPATRVRHSHRLLFTLLVAMVLLFAGGYYWFTLAGGGDNPSATVRLDGGCEVVILQGLDDIERHTLNKQIQQIMTENKQPCDSSRRFYFDRHTSFSTQNFGRTILSSCKLNSRGHIISCANFYYLDWRTN